MDHPLGSYYLIKFLRRTHGVFTLLDTEIDTSWVVQNCVEVFIFHRDRHKHRFTLSSVNLLVSVSVSVSESASVNEPFQLQNRGGRC